MNSEQERLMLVGAGVVDHVGRTAGYVERLTKGGASLEEVVVRLEERIESARVELEACLRGFDSFDVLAFIRLGVDLSNRGERRESESRVEDSQAAQDVIALTLLGMGLPRTPLTGENAGQPNPGRAMSLAGELVTAARLRAVLRGRAASQPLGALAGEFNGYELSVRGRQYDSVATELNTGLLADPAVTTLLKGTLGFSLAEIRAVRGAAIALVNERFFGARDRVGEIARQGAAPTEAEAAEVRHAMNLMVNECRLFGAVSAADVADHAGVNQLTTSTILDFFSSTRPGSGQANPIDLFADGSRPTPWGCLADDGEYLMLNGFLGEDELRRDIERGLIAATTGRRGAAGKTWARYDRRRCAFSESRMSAALSALLGGATPVWAGQKYIGPVSTRDATHMGQGGDRAGVEIRDYESDLLFVVDGVAFCVEVKAGMVTEKARGGHARRLASDLEKTLKEGNEQADRLASLIRTNAGVWGPDERWVEVRGVQEIHSVIVMLDDMGPLSLSMNELAHKGIVETDEVPWIVSIHDLIVISHTIDHPAQFLEFLRRRRARKLATMVNGVDELDMFMWFLGGGMYFEPDPHEVAAQIPVVRPVKSSDQRRFDEQPRVRLGTLTDPLDDWFYSREGSSADEAPKPVRREEAWVEQYLATSEDSKTPGWLRFGADLVGLSGVAQRDIGRELAAQCRRARGATIEHSLTTHGTTAYGAWLLTAAAVPDGASCDHLPEYMDAKQYQTHANRAMLLLYKPDGTLTSSRYRGEPWPRTPELDTIVEIAPLHSLAATFTNPPPSARRKTRRLRGRASSKKRHRGS